ncbi:MAG TPA: pilus assembly protein PilP [Gallionella sp.]|nr:pilus assembly protein PilP [Gallionella sp.]
MFAINPPSLGNTLPHNRAAKKDGEKARRPSLLRCALPMNTTLVHRTLIIFALACLAACSTLSVEDSVNRTVEKVREAAATGFVDVTINYTDPNLYISGHAYSGSHVARLMRSIVIDKSTDLKLIEIRPQGIEGQSTVAFQLIEPDIGSLRKWSGPITLEFPRSASPADLSSNMLHAYSLNKLMFLAVIGTGQQKSAVIRTPDGALYRVQEGRSIGKEMALINEINEKSLILLERTGTRRELKIVQHN